MTPRRRRRHGSVRRTQRPRRRRRRRCRRPNRLPRARRRRTPRGAQVRMRPPSAQHRALQPGTSRPRSDEPRWRERATARPAAPASEIDKMVIHSDAQRRPVLTQRPPGRHPPGLHLGGIALAECLARQSPHQLLGRLLVRTITCVGACLGPHGHDRAANIGSRHPAHARPCVLTGQDRRRRVGPERVAAIAATTSCTVAAQQSCCRPPIAPSARDPRTTVRALMGDIRPVPAVAG